MKKKLKTSVALGKGESSLVIDAGETTVVHLPLKSLTVEHSLAVEFWRRYKLEVAADANHIAELYLGHAFYRGASPEALDILSSLVKTSEAQRKQIGDRWASKKPEQKLIPLRKRKVGT